MHAMRVNSRKPDLNPVKKTKADFIRALQSKEGNFPCFETANNFCDQIDCCWRSACLSGDNLEKWEAVGFKMRVYG